MKFKKNFQYLGILLFLGILGFLAYFLSQNMEAPEKESDLINVGAQENLIVNKKEEIEGEQEESVGLVNPASQRCIEDGGTLEIREDEEGNQTGYCIFIDGRECEEWDYFNGECE